MWDTYQKTIVGALFLIVGLMAGFWLGRQLERGGLQVPAGIWTPTGTPAPRAVTPPSAGGAASVGMNAVAVNDQPPGSTVSIALVTLAADGWVVIHEESDGKPGRILGAQRFGIGQGLQGSVELLRPTVEGKVYFAMLHADDGDHEFNSAKDLPLTDTLGNPIMMRFVAAAYPAPR